MTTQELRKLLGCERRAIPTLALRERWKRKKLPGRNQYDYTVTADQLLNLPKPKRGRPFKDKFK